MSFQIYELSDNQLIIPMAASKIQAGFPSPAEDYEEERIDLADILITNKASTYCVRVKGNSMVDANIFNDDVLVVDKSLEASHGKIVIAVVDGEFTVKTLYRKDGLVKLIPANSEYPEIILTSEQELNIWGIVSYIIHKAQ
ncbi:MAG: translesion error-prone DNA polymerase V autoproteolytic subunit [Neisseriales bacterium]|nr:MAG: translesion error-prone DNA polymerase V autoproteolytic subunit [Neisseriales bacterium]